MPLNMKTIECPFCKAILSRDATKCVGCCAVKNESLYNIWGVVIFGIGGLLLFPSTFYFLFQVNVVLTSEIIETSSLVVSASTILFLLSLILAGKKSRFLKGKWTRYA